MLAPELRLKDKQPVPAPLLTGRRARSEPAVVAEHQRAVGDGSGSAAGDGGAARTAAEGDGLALQVEARGAGKQRQPLDWAVRSVCCSPPPQTSQAVLPLPGFTGPPRCPGGWDRKTSEPPSSVVPL